MTEEWHYANEGGEQVPTSEKHLKQLASEKQITAATLVWNPDLPDWKPCGSVRPEWFANLPVDNAPPALPVHIQSHSGKQAHPLAVASIVCAIIALLPMPCLGPLAFIVLPIPIIAVVCGHMALSKIRHADSSFSGRGLAIAGLITGYLGLASCLLMTVLMGFISLAPSFDIQ